MPLGPSPPRVQVARLPPTRPPEPPPAPEIPRRIRLHPYQWIGLVVLGTLPVLAIFGVFGGSPSVSEVRGRGIEATVEAPSRLRDTQLERIEVRVRNLSAASLDTVRIALDTGFASHFSEVHGIPGFERPFELAVAGVPAGGTGTALIELRAERRGRHTGNLTVAAGGDTLRIPLRVTVYP